MSATAKDGEGGIRLVVEQSGSRSELEFDSVEVVANTAAHVVVLFKNERGEKARATLPKALLRPLASLKALW